MKWGSAAAAVGLALCLLVAVPGLLDFWQPRWVLAGAALVLIGLLIAWRGVAAPDLLDAAILALVAWAALSIAWSPDPLNGASSGLKFAAVATAFLVARRLGPDLARYLGPVVALAVAASIAFDWFESEWHGGFGNENFHAEFLLVALPLLYWHDAERSRWVKWACWLVALSAALWLLGGRSQAPLAVMAVLALAYAAFGVRRDMRLLVGGFAAAAVVLALAYVPAIAWSATSRAELAINTAAMWRDAPVRGHGLGSYVYVYPEYADTDRNLLKRKDTAFPESRTYVGSAHNEFLQLGAELGLVGFGLAVLALGLAWRWIRRAVSAGGTLAGTAISAGIAAIIALFSAPLQTPVVSLLAALCLGCVVPIGARNMVLRLPARAVLALIAVIAGVGGGYLGYKTIVGQSHMAYGMIVRADPEREWQHVVTAWYHAPHDQQIRLQLYQSWFMLANRRMENFDQDVGEWTWRISTSASPHNTRLLLLRLSHLGQVGRCEAECGSIMDWLADHAARVLEVRTLDMARKGQT